MPLNLTDAQRRTLAAYADTVVADVPSPDAGGGEYWRTTASDLGVPARVEAALVELVPDEDAAGVGQLLDALGGLGLAAQPLPLREVIVTTVAGMSRQAREGLTGIRSLVLLHAFGGTPEGRPNPLWAGMGYPGPVAVDADEPLLPVHGPPVDDLRADVVVVGSGAGGGVAAAEAAAAGLDVVVLEAGDAYSARDFGRDELWASRHLYYRGRLATTADTGLGMQAGAVLGGGTTVNWSNCVRPRADVLQRWAVEHGLTGVDGPEFADDVEAVLARLGATEACSDPNGPHQRMLEGAERLGWSVHRAMLNLDPDRYRFDAAGQTGNGDATGAKRSTVRSYLQDAVGHGARVHVRSKARRILVEDGRAAGVEVAGQGGTVVVRAPVVVVACGALETPALLLRSGIGGPAVGQGLRLHPTTALVGVYDEPTEPWRGPTHAAVLDEFTDHDEGHGFLVEGLHFDPGASAAGLPFTGAAAHKRLLSRVRHVAPWIAMVQDRGAGTVSVDAAGEAVHRYPLEDPLDRRNLYAGLAALARLHEAAGAAEVLSLAPGVAPWVRGESLDAFVDRLHAAPLGTGGHVVGSAHQMATARMGTDPATSVADPHGQLHDVAGVWIADTSAFPTCTAVNPMVTCMALARRTARTLLTAADRAGASRD